MPSIRLAAGFLLALAACQAPSPSRATAPADPAAGEIAFEWAGPQQTAIVVPVHVNGTGPHQFILDTGATLTCVSDELAAGLALPEAGGQIGIGAGVGSAGRMRLVRIDSLRVGAARAEGLQACALDLAHARSLGVEFSGLLGLNFLRSYRMILDFDREVLLLHQPE